MTMCWSAIELECGHIVLKTQSICCEKLIGFEYINPLSCFLCDTELLLDNYTLSSFCKQKLGIKPWYKVVFTGYAKDISDGEEDDGDELQQATIFLYDNFGNIIEATPPPKQKGRKKWTNERLEEFLMWEISLGRVVDLAKEAK